MKKYSVSLRPATEDDLPQVVKIESYSNAPPWSEKSFQQELQKKFSHFWVLTDDATDSLVKGYIVFALPADQAHIQTIAVHKDFRRKGLARKILRDVISFSLRQEAASVVLEVDKENKEALSLYQSMGFVITHSMEQSGGGDGYSLILRLDGMKPVGQHNDVKKQNLN